jgi:hypothetical protein
LLSLRSRLVLLLISSLSLLLSAFSNVDRRVLAIEGQSRVVSISLPVVLLPLAFERKHRCLPLSDVLESTRLCNNRSTRSRTRIQEVLPATQMHVSCVDPKRKARHRPPATPSLAQSTQKQTQKSSLTKTNLSQTQHQDHAHSITTANKPTSNNQREIPWQNKPFPATCISSA